MHDITAVTDTAKEMPKRIARRSSQLILDKDQDTRQKLPGWVPLLLGPAILLGLGVAAFLIWIWWKGKPFEPGPFYLSVLLLLFSLGMLTSLVFSTNSSLQGNFGKVSLIVTGPAVLWLGGTIYMMKDATIQRALFAPYLWPSTLQGFEDNVLSVEKESGWMPYKEWKIRNRNYHELMIKGERNLASELLENAFSYPNPADETLAGRNLLEESHVATAFLYFDDFVVKFQAISGQREDQAADAQVFFANRSAEGEKSPLQAIFFASPKADKKEPGAIMAGLTETTATPERYGWETVQGEDDIYCLIVVKYEAGSPNVKVSQKQDSLITDMKKFTRGQGTLDLAIFNFSHRIASTSTMWRMKGSVGTMKRQIPLVFRRHDSGRIKTEGKAPDDPGNAARVWERLSPWMPLLDEYLTRGKPSELVKSDAPVEFGELGNSGEPAKSVDPAKPVNPAKPGEPAKAGKSDKRAREFLEALRVTMTAALKEHDSKVGDLANFEKVLAAAAGDKTIARGVVAFHVEQAEDVNVALVKPQLY
jgi:hypothetical protein